MSDLEKGVSPDSTRSDHSRSHAGDILPVDRSTCELNGRRGGSGGRYGDSSYGRHRSAGRDRSDGDAVVIVVIVIDTVVIIVVIIRIVNTIIVVVVVVINRNWSCSRGSRCGWHCGEGGADGDVVIVIVVVVVVVDVGCCWGGGRSGSGRHSGYSGADGVVVIVIVVVVVVFLGDDCCWEQGKEEVRPMNHFECGCEMMLAASRLDYAEAKEQQN
jgi:hypothetical protein